MEVQTIDELIKEASANGLSFGSIHHLVMKTLIESNIVDFYTQEEIEKLITIKI